MQIIHPYRHNTVIVCIFIPFDWQTATASLLSSLAIKKKPTTTKSSPEWPNGFPFHGRVEIQKVWGRCSPNSNEGASMPPSPQPYYVSKSTSWPSVQMGRTKSALGNPRTGLRRQSPRRIAELEAGACLLARSCTPSHCNTSKGILHWPRNADKPLLDKLIMRKSFLSPVTAK